jgi:ribosomal protein L11 methyltransferase
VAAFPDARTTDVADGWEDRWRDFHHPVRVGPLWVGPPWLEPPRGVTAIVIDPGRAFGTGSHATTRLCLELLLEQPQSGVLDVGCGSGVLAIAAARLGHAPVTAIDMDEAAVTATNSNARGNGVTVDARRLDALEGELPHEELALANIALGAVEALGGRLASRLVITSGYLVSDEPSLAGFRRVERRKLDGWAADLHERR